MAKDGYLVTASATERGVAITLSRALLAGFLASVAMVMAYALAFVLALIVGTLPLGALSDWCAGLTSNQLIDMARPNLFAALAIFVAGGLIWAVLYGIFAEPRLHGPAWERGVLFALIPCLFSLVVFLPL